MKVPFNIPALLGGETENIQQAFRQRKFSGGGPFTTKCEEYLEKTLGVKRVLLTTSCTHALEMCGLLLNLQPEDEVIVPSFTFPSTATAFALRGAKIVFVDVKPETLSLDEDAVTREINSKTRALVAVNYGGLSPQLDRLRDLAEKSGVPLIEDNAHGLFGKYRGRFLGTYGRMGTLSFHESKNFSCGEGGALILNSDEDIRRAEVIREKGTNRSQFFRGEVDKYTWVDQGSSYVLSEILAAFLWEQLSNRELIQARRRDIWHGYKDRLQSWAETEGILLPSLNSDHESAYHLFYMIMPDESERQRMIEYLRAHGVSATFHYQALHSSPQGRMYRTALGGCLLSESLSGCLLRLPLYYDLTEEAQEHVIHTVQSYRRSTP